MIHEFLRYTQKSKMPWKLVVGKPARFEGGGGGGAEYLIKFWVENSQPTF